MICWRRLRDWQEEGVWEQLHFPLLKKLRQADLIDWSRASADKTLVRAAGGGEETGPKPTDSRKLGSKDHTLVDADGTPLITILTGANCHDSTQLIPLVDGARPVGGKPGGLRRRPEKLYADRAYDSQSHRERIRARGIEPFLAKRNTPHGSGMPIYRWVSERTLSWLHQYRCLRKRYERRADIHKGSSIWPRA